MFFTQLRKENINAIVQSTVVTLLRRAVCNSTYPELFQKMLKWEQIKKRSSTMNEGLKMCNC